MKIPNWLWLSVAAVLLQLCYLPTRQAGFVTDFTGLAQRIEGHSAAGILTSFGFPALQPVTSFFYYLFYHNFSVNSWGWYLSATLLHTANALLLFFLARRLIKSETSFLQNAVAGLGALFFLFSPYASEVVVWRVCFHYLLVSFLVLSMLWYTQLWLEQPERRRWWAILGLQLAALLTYELALLTPLLSLVFILWSGERLLRQKAISRLFIPQLSLVALYFVANRLILGKWIGHYGSEVHLNFPLAEMTAKPGQYVAKWLLFSRYWPHGWKESLFQALAHPAALIVVVTLFAGLAFWMFKRFRKADRRGQFIGIFGLATLIALLPVLNLYFNYLLHIENDRYGYLAALFFYPALAALFSRLPKGLFLGLSAAFLACSVWLLYRTNTWWHQSTQVYRGLLADFEAYDRDTCYLLNLPDNLQGAPMFRDYSGQDQAFRDALQYVQQKSYDGVLKEVVQYNMVSLADGVQVEADSAGLKVTFNQWGNWWWRRGIGASSYRDSSYFFHNEGHHFRLEWRSVPENAAILYQSGQEWKIWDP